jgi:hypothetical protein
VVGRHNDQRVQEFAVSEGNFSVAFRVIAGEYFDYAEALEKEQGISGCPQQCPKSKKRFDPYRSEPCKECPRKTQMDYFKQATIERWQEWFDSDAKQFNFNSMLNTFYSVKLFEDLPVDRISLKNATLISILQSERAKADLRRSSVVVPG